MEGEPFTLQLITQVSRLAELQELPKNFTYQAGHIKFRTYFSTIIRSQAVDYIRKNKSYAHAEFDHPEFDTQFDSLFQEEWRQTVLNEALDELRSRVDPITYQAFELYGLQNRSLSEVAETLEIKKEQLYVAKSRCTKMLREIVARIKASDGEIDIEL